MGNVKLEIPFGPSKSVYRISRYILHELEQMVLLTVPVPIHQASDYLFYGYNVYRLSPHSAKHPHHLD